MKISLPDEVHSMQDVQALALEIKSYAKWFSHEAIKQRAGAAGAAAEAPALSQGAAGTIKQWSGGKELSQESLENLITALEDFADSAPKLTITLAAPAGGELKNILVKWCRQNVNSAVLVDFRFNSTLLGGMVVRYGSRIFDWSFRRQILAGRERFPEVLRRV